MSREVLSDEESESIGSLQVCDSRRLVLLPGQEHHPAQGHGFPISQLTAGRKVQEGVPFAGQPQPTLDECASGSVKIRRVWSPQANSRTSRHGIGRRGIDEDDIVANDSDPPGTRALR